MKYLILALLLSVWSQGAIVRTVLNTTLRTTGTFQLHPASAGPEFALVFSNGELTIERTSFNKNSKVVGYHIGDWDGTAARLLVRDTVVWKNYAGHNHMRTDMPMPEYDRWNYGDSPWEYGWYDRPAADWKPGMTGYLGLLTDPTDGAGVYHAGWLHLRWNPDGSITLLGCAYETVAGRPITISRVAQRHSRPLFQKLPNKRL